MLNKKTRSIKGELIKGCHFPQVISHLRLNIIDDMKLYTVTFSLHR